MEKIIQRRRSAKAWRRMLARFEASGLTAVAFCEREGISSKSFYRWRLRLGDVDQSLVASAAGAKNTARGFIDLGALRPSDSRFEVRLELGAGVILSIARG